MNLQKAKRQQVKIKLSLAGPSGTGKTYSALLLALGLCNDWNKIAVIDTENFSASLYSHLGSFNVLNLTAPFTPEKYTEAIRLCETEGMEVIIIDSISHEWSGKGGCLEIHEKETAKMRVPNSFTAWAAVTPRHQQFLDAILQSNCHVITTIRTKTEYVLTERNGRTVPQKMGMSPVTRDGFEYEVSVAFELDQQHKAFCSKDRTGLFMDAEPFPITVDTGKLLLDWCSKGEVVDEKQVKERIGECRTIQELLSLYEQTLPMRPDLKKEFEQQKKRLLVNQEVNKIVNPHNFSQNGKS